MHIHRQDFLARRSDSFMVGLLLILSIMISLSCSPASLRGTVNFPDSSGRQYRAKSNRLDVPYVPTPMEVLRTYLELGSVGPGDFLIDLGSGDGRVVITAAKEYGARGFGVDLNQELVALSKEYAAAQGVEDKVDFFVRDFFDTDIHQATVVTMYLYNDINLKLRPKLMAELKPGSRVLTQDFHLGDWRPDSLIHLDIGKSYQDDTVVYLWIVPAHVKGKWKWSLPLQTENLRGPNIYTYELDVNQHFQHISGMVRSGGYDLYIFNAGLRGDEIHFSVYVELDERMIRQDYKGRVDGDLMVGTVQLFGAPKQTRLTWQATRDDG